MTESTVAFSDLAESKENGAALGAKINREFKNVQADVAIVFASSKYNYTELLGSLSSSCNPKLIVGCSSAGEFIGGTREKVRSQF